MAQTRRPSLRERKYAQTKLAMMNAVIERLDEKSFDAMSVKELADAVPVSEATFFNYFSKKSDLIGYVSQLWGMEVCWWGNQVAQETPGVPVIQAVFDRTAQQTQEQPKLMGELIAWQARLREKPELPPVTLAERQLAFADLRGVEDMSETGIEALLAANLQKAIDQNELPPNTPINTVMVTLLSVFYGVPLALRLSNPSAIGNMYRQQLMLLWNGIRAATSVSAGV